jgi:hypothetical protein
VAGPPGDHASLRATHEHRWPPSLLRPLRPASRGEPTPLPRSLYAADGRILRAIFTFLGMRTDAAPEMARSRPAPRSFRAAPRNRTPYQPRPRQVVHRGCTKEFTRSISLALAGAMFLMRPGNVAWSAPADHALWQKVKHASDCNGGASHAAPAGHDRSRRGTKPAKAARVRNRCTLLPIATRASGGLDRNPVPVEAGAAKAVEVSRGRGNERDGPGATRSAFGSMRAANGPGGFSDLDAGAILQTRSPRAACLRGPSKEGACRRCRGPARQPSRARERSCFRSRTGNFPISLAKSASRPASIRRVVPSSTVGGNDSVPCEPWTQLGEISEPARPP